MSNIDVNITLRIGHIYVFTTDTVCRYKLASRQGGGQGDVDTLR